MSSFPRKWAQCIVLHIVHGPQLLLMGGMSLHPSIARSQFDEAISYGEVEGDVVRLDLAFGRFWLQTTEEVIVFRDHPVALQDLLPDQRLAFRTLVLDTGERWRWHPMNAFSSPPASWATGILSGSIDHIDVAESTLWLNNEKLHAHPSQLTALNSQQSVVGTYTEREGIKWLLYVDAAPVGTGRPSGLFTQEALPAGPGMGTRAGEMPSFSRGSVPNAGQQAPQDAAAIGGPVGVGIWGPPDAEVGPSP